MSSTGERVMPEKPVVIVDPSFRKMAEIFSPADLERIHQLVKVIWGKDDPMPMDTFCQAVPEALAVVCADWRYGDEALRSASSLRAILTVSGGFPRNLDYETCF